MRRRERTRTLEPLEPENPAMIYRMPKLISSIVVLCAVCSPVCYEASGQGGRPRAEHSHREDRAPIVFLDSTKEIDGLKGPVRRVETEIVRVQLKRGELVPVSRSLLERTLYDERGRRVENETYPIVGSRAGQETHKYDAQGNLAETVVRDARGAVLSRTIYDYELDAFGNWIQMTASLAVSRSGKVEYEPTEITKRNITYYLTKEPSASAADGASAARKDASPAPVAEGDKVSKRAESSVTTKPEPDAPDSPAAEGEPLHDAGVLNERAGTLPKPAYPVSWKRLDEPVTVAVEVVLDITGRVVSARARSGPDVLRRPSERAARRATFLPFYVGGRPVRARGLINYTFDFLP